MRWRALAVALCLVGSTLGGTAGEAAAAPSRGLIQGSGSSWASNAVNTWIAGAKQQGLQIVYTSTGSAQGRRDFANATTDFAVTDVAYQGTDPLTNDTDVPCKTGSTADCRDFSYVPLVAGGTSFPYQLRVDGKLVRNLRLSGATLAGIFTGEITRWDDPRIRDDNNGRVLPATPIVPVVHSEGSGASFEFGRFVAHEYPEQWATIAGTAQPTPYWPRFAGAVGQSGSDGVVNFVSSAAADGAIGYDEYSYPLAKGFPVAKVQNRAGNFVLPEPFNVALALRRAVAHPDGPSDLTGVWADADPRSYPLSSFASMIVPTAPDDPRMTTGKRQALVDFVHYSACQGQSSIAPVGYAPLPLDLTRAALNGAARVAAADPRVDLTKRDITTCDNPTFEKGDAPRDRLDEITPAVPACDHVGAGPCEGTGTDTGTGTTPQPERVASAVALGGGRTIRAGEVETLTGSVRDPRGAVTGVAVAVVSTDRVGTRRVATVRTDARGTFRVAVRPVVDTRYVARFDGDRARLGATSGAVPVGVAYAVGVRVSHRSVRRGDPVVVTGTVTPARPGDAVVLQRQVGRQWRSAAAAVAYRSGRAIAFRFRYVPASRTTVLRVVRPAGPDNHAGASAAFRLRVR